MRLSESVRERKLERGKERESERACACVRESVCLRASAVSGTAVSGTGEGGVAVVRCSILSFVRRGLKKSKGPGGRSEAVESSNRACIWTRGKHLHRRRQLDRNRVVCHAYEGMVSHMSKGGTSHTGQQMHFTRSGPMREEKETHTYSLTRTHTSASSLVSPSPSHCLSPTYKHTVARERRRLANLGVHDRSGDVHCRA